MIYKDLDVWKESKKLVKDIYVITGKYFPKEEIYGITSQIRRAAISIPCNIAEGDGRRSKKDYLRFVNIARGSFAELETLLSISEDLNYIDNETLSMLNLSISKIGSLLSGFATYLQKQIDN